jgi:hypothetical protein
LTPASRRSYIKQNPQITDALMRGFLSPLRREDALRNAKT